MSTDTAYIFYRSPGSVASQNRNFVDPRVASEFPRRLYKGEPMGGSHCQPFQFECPTLPRDCNIEYSYPVANVAAGIPGRSIHPANFSRFSYPWCPNGYCTGNHPGRYNTPPGMMWQTSAMPPGMAPARFYEGNQIDPNYVLSTAYIDAYRARMSA